MEKIKGILTNKITQIVVTAFFGVLLIASSYTLATAYRASRGAQVDPFLFALGVTLLVVSFIIYRKWSSELDSKKQ